MFSIFFFNLFCVLRDLHSFPTRRSSDLAMTIEKLNIDEEYDIAVIDEAQLFSHRSEEHTSELQSRGQLVCRLLLEKKNLRICKELILLYFMKCDSLII